MASTTKTCDLLVIGGGPGGFMCADRASAKYGATTILVESNRLGGTCVNVGCKPKKLMWNAATISSQIKEAHAYDFSIDKHMIFDWASF